MIKQIALIPVLLATALTTNTLPLSANSDVQETWSPLKWLAFQIAPAGWNYVSSQEGVDTYLLSEGVYAGDTLTLCNTIGLQHRKTYANTFCQSPTDPKHITTLLTNQPDPTDTYTPALQKAIIAQHLPTNTAPTPTIHLQPPKGWAYTNIKTILYLTYPNPQHTLTIGNHTATYTWEVAYHDIDFDDGPHSHYQTAHNGAPYPHDTINHTYTQPGTAQPKVTTTWNALVTIPHTHTTYRLNKITTTTTTTNPIQLRKPQIQLTNPTKTPTTP